MEPLILFKSVNRTILGYFIEIFAKKVNFYALFWYNKKQQKSLGFFCEYYYKIAKNRPIEIKLTVLNRQDYAIFKTPRFSRHSTKAFLAAFLEKFAFNSVSLSDGKVEIIIALQI